MIVLDTHALIWWVNGDEQLSARARKAIEKEVGSGQVFISAITAWEVAMLVEKGSSDLDDGCQRLAACTPQARSRWSVGDCFRPQAYAERLKDFQHRRQFWITLLRQGFIQALTCKADRASDVDRLAVVELRWRK